MKPIPCPACGVVAFIVGPAGPPERRCWGCDHVFTPTQPIPAPKPRWIPPHRDRLVDLVKAIAVEPTVAADVEVAPEHDREYVAALLRDERQVDADA